MYYVYKNVTLNAVVAAVGIYINLRPKSQTKTTLTQTDVTTKIKL